MVEEGQILDPTWRPQALLPGGNRALDRSHPSLEVFVGDAFHALF